MLEKEVWFYSDGLRLEGSLYLPNELKPGETRPGVIVCSGYLGLKAIYPRLFADSLTRAGYVVLGFDYRGNGASMGTAGRLLIEEQERDIMNGISFMKQLPEVDPHYLTLVGWGMGAASVVEVAARDDRVHAVAALNGFYEGQEFLRARHDEESLTRLRAKLERDRSSRVTTGQGEYTDPYEIYPLDPDTQAEVNAHLVPVPGFGPPTAFELMDSLLALDAVSVVHKISPHPLFVAHGEQNELHPIAGALSLYEKAREPKTFYRINGKHNDFMVADNPQFQALVQTLTEWIGDQVGPLDAR